VSFTSTDFVQKIYSFLLLSRRYLCLYTENAMPIFSRRRNLSLSSPETGSVDANRILDRGDAGLARILKRTAIVLTLMLVFPPFRYLLPNGVEINLGYSLIFSPPLATETRVGSVNIPLLLTQVAFVVLVAACAAAWNYVVYRHKKL